jgi:hypothetical protein
LNARTYVPPGQKACFVFAVAPTGAIPPVELPLDFAGDNTAPVPALPGINTLLLSASTVSGPDIVALAATPGNDGVAPMLGTPGTGAFAVATVNVGAQGAVIVSADTGTESLPVSLALCPTDPGSGACLTPPAATVITSIESGGTPTFGVFLQTTESIALDPARARAFLRFKDTDGLVRGSTSVAVTTQYDVVRNGSFERPFANDWKFFADGNARVTASLERSTATVSDGAYAAAISVTAAGRLVDVQFWQGGTPLVANATYTLRFTAKASNPRTMRVNVLKDGGDFHSYGLSAGADLAGEWREYAFEFRATETAADGRVNFYFGEQAGVTWLDGVSLERSSW